MEATAAFKLRLKTEGGAKDAPVRRVLDLTDTCIGSLGAIRIFTFPKAVAIGGLLFLVDFYRNQPFVGPGIGRSSIDVFLLGDSSKITLGAVEDIIFKSLGIRFPARLR